MPYICRSARADGEIKMDSIHWVSAARSDTGRKRKVNEDAIFVSDTQALWCVADGMGGHKRGDAASQLVAFTMGKLPPQQHLPDIVEEIDSGLQSAHKLLYRESNKDGQIIGSTVVAAAAVDDLLAILWAGDSRAYLFRDGRSYALTRDHTQLETLIDQGEVLPEDVVGHPAGRVVTRAVGAAEDLVLDIEVVKVQIGDWVLLCSDGLGKHVRDDELIEFFSHPDEPDQVADALLTTVLERGASDNISVVVMAAGKGEPRTGDLRSSISAQAIS